MRWSILAACALLTGTEVAAVTGEALPPPRPAASFISLDQNRDGRLSRDEAAAVPRLVLDFDVIDIDGDGRLTPAEYSAWFARR